MNYQKRLKQIKLLRIALIVWDELQEILYSAIKNRAYSRQDVDIQSCYSIIAVIIDLWALHFCLMAQLVLAYALFFN